MAAILDTVKVVWEILRNGARVDVEGKVVNALPHGASMNDLGGWSGPVSYPEKFQEVSAWFESDLANFTITPNWQYNGNYIANFNVLAEGTVDVLSSIDVSVTTFEANLNADGIVEMPYHVDVTFHNVTGGTLRRTYRAIARGDGTGMSVA